MELSKSIADYEFKYNQVCSTVLMLCNQVDDVYESRTFRSKYIAAIPHFPIDTTKPTSAMDTIVNGVQRAYRIFKPESTILDAPIKYLDVMDFSFALLTVIIRGVAEMHHVNATLVSNNVDYAILCERIAKMLPRLHVILHSTIIPNDSSLSWNAESDAPEWL